MSGFSGGAGPLGTRIQLPEIEDLPLGSGIFGDGSGGPSEEPAGANDTVLTADDTKVRGVKWVPPADSIGDNFAYVYDKTTQPIALANTYQDLNFDTNPTGMLDGWTHVAGTNLFGCNFTAKYKVILNVNIEKTGGGARTAGVRGLFNGVEVEGSYRGIDITASSAAEPADRVFYVNGISGQDLEMEFAGSDTNVQIAPGPIPDAPVTNPSATISIKRVT